MLSKKERKVLKEWRTVGPCGGAGNAPGRPCLCPHGAHGQAEHRAPRGVIRPPQQGQHRHKGGEEIRAGEVTREDFMEGVTVRQTPESQLPGRVGEEGTAWQREELTKAQRKEPRTTESGQVGGVT